MFCALGIFYLKEHYLYAWVSARGRFYLVVSVRLVGLYTYVGNTYSKAFHDDAESLDYFTGSFQHLPIVAGKVWFALGAVEDDSVNGLSRRWAWLHLSPRPCPGIWRSKGDNLQTSSGYRRKYTHYSHTKRRRRRLGTWSEQRNRH